MNHTITAALSGSVGNILQALPMPVFISMRRPNGFTELRKPRSRKALLPTAADNIRLAAGFSDGLKNSLKNI